MKKSQKLHYVDNKLFLQAMIEWKEKCLIAEKEGKSQLPVTDYIGECFLKLQPIYHIDPILSITHIEMR